MLGLLDCRGDDGFGRPVIKVTTGVACGGDLRPMVELQRGAQLGAVGRGLCIGGVGC